jgi:hypothetical protein
MSDFTIMTIREVPDAPLSHDDALLYPVPAQEQNTVQAEQLDGDDVVRLQARALKVRFADEKKPFLDVSEVRADLVVTDSRVALACSKYDKGGGWIGGPTVLVLNAGSKLLAARRRRGKMLLGQVRHPWLAGVYAQSRTGMLSDEMLRLVVREGEQRVLLDVTFPKSVDACEVGAEIARRAATFRLLHEEQLEAAERGELARIAEIERFSYAKGDRTLAGVSFPTHWQPAHNSARIGLGKPVGR